jgi:hypothetical protein
VAEPAAVEVQKNAREVVRVEATTYKGWPVIDARVWTVPVTPEGESKPTRKGLTLQPATWTEVLRAVQAFLGSAPFSKGSAEPFETERSADHTASVLGDDTDPFAGDV